MQPVRIMLTMAPCACAALLAAAGPVVPRVAQAQSTYRSPDEVFRPSAPFTDAWSEMVRRDAAWRTLEARGFSTPLRHGGPVPQLAKPFGASPAASTSAESPGDAVPTAAPSAWPAVTSSFPALTLNDEFTTFQFGSWPPDTTGILGPHHFVE